MHLRYRNMMDAVSSQLLSGLPGQLVELKNDKSLIVNPSDCLGTLYLNCLNQHL